MFIHPPCLRNLLLWATAFSFLLTAATTVAAQYQIESWTTDNGLPQNTIHSIIQTPDGYLWLTTLDGLVRFDGVKFTIFNKQNTRGITGNRFTQMLIDASGDLWIATEESGVTRYRDGVFQTFEITDNALKKPIRNLVLNNGNELFALTTADVFKWNGERFAAADLPDETKDAMALHSKNGAFWYLKRRTLSFLQPFTDNQELNRKISFSADGLADVGKFLTDSRGRLWIGTKTNGLLLVENGNISVYNSQNGLPSDNCLPQIEDKDGNLWITTDKGAAIIAADGKINLLTTEQGLSDNDLKIIYQDREGSVWIGTTYRGLNRVSRNRVAFFTKRDGLAGNGSNPIFQDRDGAVWIGGGELSVWRDRRFSPVSGRERFSSQSVTAIEQDRAGRLWFGHWGGVYFYENGEFTDFNEKLNSAQAVFAITETSDGVMWFAAEGGLLRYQNGSATRLTVADGLAGNNVKVIHESGDGTLWFGTYGGLSKYRNGAFKSFTTADGLASNLVRSIYEDADGVLWIGSYDGGLTRLKDGKLTAYTSNDGLFNDGVFQILEDAGGNFWMSCNRGIYRVAKKQLNYFADGKLSRIESIAYDKSDGLLETECNGGQQPAGTKTADGKLWFPTQGGVAVIDPEKITTNPFAPPVLIETIKIDNELLEIQPSELRDLQSAIEIAPGKNNLEIAYTALSFIKPEFVKFRYRLLGLDKDWVEAGNRRTAYYSYLPPGNYEFQVIAANADGVWNTGGATIEFVVAPPFYRTFWFWILSAATVSGAAFVFYRQRVRKLESEKQAQQAFSRKLLESQEQERQRIAANLHDSIGQSLLIIKNRAFLALNDLDEPETVREQLEELSESATGAIEECREISYNLRPYNISRFGLTKTLEAIFKRIAEVTDIETTVRLDDIDDCFAPEA